jgi:diaminopimelate epimerase
MPSGLFLGCEFFKGHGLGNDYLVFREGTSWKAATSAIRSVCDRTTGVGADGIVVLLGAGGTPVEPFRLRMFNPDGSEFERSGNGLRILGAFLFLQGWVREDEFKVEVGGDEVVLRIEGHLPDGQLDVSAQMGLTRHGPDAIELDPSALGSDGCLDLGAAGRVPIVPVSVGNPHAVVFGEELSDRRLAEIGPKLATHRAIVSGTNVQLARVESDALISALIWERGVGVTASSGTSACAVASAAVYSGAVQPGEIEIRMPGGSMWVCVGSDLSVTLRGPVQPVYSGSLAPGFL